MSQDIDKRPISMIQQIGTAGLAQSVERIHGKDEVAGSIPAISMMNRKKPNFNGLFCIGDDIKTSNSPAIIGDGILLGQSVGTDLVGLDFYQIMLVSDPITGASG